MTAEDDISWSADKKLHGWTLPQTAWPLKLWGIRHIRWMWLTNQVYQAADRWAAMGIGFGGPNQYDRWVLYAIYRGDQVDAAGGAFNKLATNTAYLPLDRWL
jgi:hypothetical protein